MQKKDPKSMLVSATMYVAIIIFAVVYKSHENGTPVRQTTLAFFIIAVLFLGYQWFRYIRNRKNDR